MISTKLQIPTELAIELEYFMHVSNLLSMSGLRFYCDAVNRFFVIYRELDQISPDLLKKLVKFGEISVIDTGVDSNPLL